MPDRRFGVRISERGRQAATPRRGGADRAARVRLGVVAVTVVLVGALLGGSGDAVAAPPVGAYPDWTVAGASPAWSGAATFAGVANFPVGSYTSDSSSVTSPTGASAFLNAATPFGARFGSSQGRPYLNVRTASGNAPSTTTITFADPTPASGWGFALGDVDADQVMVTATGADGAPLATAALGFTGTFNYCAASPVPSSCSGPATDAPVWDPSTSTLRGNVADTTGATGWFQPQAPVRSLTFVFSALSGAPIYQLWLASTTATVSGTVLAPDPSGAPVALPDTVVRLEDPAGAPVPGPAGAPVTTTTGGDGAFVLPGVVTGEYQLVVDPPTGFDPTVVPIDLTAGDVTGIEITVQRHTTAPAAPAPAPAAELTPRFTG